MEIWKGLLSEGFYKIHKGAQILLGNGGSGEEYTDEEDMDMTGGKTAVFGLRELDSFRNDVGRYPAETGGLLGSTRNPGRIDLVYFDAYSRNTSGSFYYDVETMSEVFRKWKAAGYQTNGIFHSHPHRCIHPSFHDVSSALLHLEFLHLDYFYLPIFQPSSDGCYTMYFYVVRLNGNYVDVNLDYVLAATPETYRYVRFRPWGQRFPVVQLRSYREALERPVEEKCPLQREPFRRGTGTAVQPVQAMSAKPAGFSETQAGSMLKPPLDAWKKPAAAPTNAYFQKVKGLYPEKVLEKVIVCVGTGGARSFLENCARCGFRNYVLIDADTVSPSNVATQGVYISEMGRKKVDVIRERILDVNPRANIVCVDRFLDDHMSDCDFKSYLDRFPNKKPTDYLILGCTDNFEAQKRSSLLALKYGTPYLAAMMYERGAAAELIFVYPGVTKSCPRCLLRERFEKYENGFKNDVDSSACPIFATERMNALKGYIALMLLTYRENGAGSFSRMLDEVKDRNFVEIRLDPHLKDSKLGIGLFDKVFAGASRYTFMDETVWVPQHPDSPEYGAKPCRLCGGTGDLRVLQSKWAQTDTRNIRFDEAPAAVSAAQLRQKRLLSGQDLPDAAGGRY